jgi:hypothetical protein
LKQFHVTGKRKGIFYTQECREHLQLLDDREPLKNGKRFFSFTNEKVPRAFTTSCQSRATGKRQSTKESRELLAMHPPSAGEFRAA